MGLAKRFISNMGVDLSSGNLRMTKKLLNGSKVGSVSQKIGRKRMAQPMGSNFF